MCAAVTAKSPWIVSFAPRPNASVRLFCLPHAGGSATVFRDWAEDFPQSVSVCAIELPGRGLRIRESLIESVNELVWALSYGLLPFLDRPFALFGHSMGGLLAFELTRTLRRQGQAMPVHLFLSGCTPPHRHDRTSSIHSLSDAELITNLKTLNGSCPGTLEDPDLCELMLPIIRNDLKLVDGYVYTPEAPLKVPVSVYGGTDDPGVPPDTLEEWRRYTASRCTVRILPGDHFFISPQKAHLLASISLAIEFSV